MSRVLVSLPRTVRVPCRVCRISAASLWRGKETLRSCSAPATKQGRRLYGTSTDHHVATNSQGTSQVQEIEGLLRELDSVSQSFGILPGILANVRVDPTTREAAAIELDRGPPDVAARLARQHFGSVLPNGLLNSAQLKAYERLYGHPELMEGVEEGEGIDDADRAVTASTGLLREAGDGSLEEIDFVDKEESMTMGEGEAELRPEDVLHSRDMMRLKKSKKGKFFALAAKAELDARILEPEMNRAEEAAMSHLDDQWKQMDDDEQVMYLDDVRYLKLERHLRNNDRDDEADELLRCLFIHYEAGIEKANEADQAALGGGGSPGPLVVQPEEDGQTEDDDPLVQRTHPLTLDGRFATSPTTIELPKSTLTGPTSALISGTSPNHLLDAATRIFGGPGLPYSTSNPHFARSMPQKFIPLNPYQEDMSDVEADAYMAAVMPGTYASIMSVLVETRKRLGVKWLASLMDKEGGPRILDAGGAGAGIIAFREVLRAEWERLMDNSEDPEASKGLTFAGGQAGGAPAKPPQGKATTLTASSALRQRASVMLDDTTFVPRLPDYIHASDPRAAQHGKFDVIFAPHSLWSLQENYLRKQHLANLWSLLNADGGVLILIEKGVPRGFEVIAGARKFLLDTRIASPGSNVVMQDIDEPEQVSLNGERDKEEGMIIAPCTNHTGCPMYTKSGVTSGRQDYCHFEQRFYRPPYLQKLLHARDKNHEDVKFSYLSIMRGRDLRQLDQENVTQGDFATQRAFEGYEDESPSSAAGRHFDPTASIDETVDMQEHSTAPHSLSLPRAIMPPLKRTGHVLLDLCTPSGTLERWTVPRSFSKQAFRDARKSSWGDLWALGAKTRTPKNVRLGKEAGYSGTINLTNVRMSKKAKKIMAQKPSKGKSKGTDIFDVPITPGDTGVKEADIKPAQGGRMRRGKISGIRDKRDKTGTGRGRRKSSLAE